jgi:hypothetical protein
MKEEIKMRKCEKCGAQNLDDALYCRTCGESLPPRKGWTSSEAYTASSHSSSGLFENAGPKLMVLAKVIFVLTLIVGEVIGISSIKASADNYYNGEVFRTIGIILIIVSPLIAWLNSIMLYAFGELCESIDRIRYNTSEIKTDVQKYLPESRNS